MSHSNSVQETCLYCLRLLLSAAFLLFREPINGRPRHSVRWSQSRTNVLTFVWSYDHRHMREVFPCEMSSAVRFDGAAVDCILYERRQFYVVRRAHTVEKKIRTRKQITDEHEPYLSRICLQPPLHVTPTHRFCSSCKWKRENSKDRRDQKNWIVLFCGQDAARKSIQNHSIVRLRVTHNQKTKLIADILLHQNESDSIAFTGWYDI